MKEVATYIPLSDLIIINRIRVKYATYIATVQLQQNTIVGKAFAIFEVLYSIANVLVKGKNFAVRIENEHLATGKIL